MEEEPDDIDVKVRAWKLATQDNLPLREVALRLGVHKSTAHRYVQEGRDAETWVLAFAKAELRRDVAYQLRELIRRWMGKLEEVQDTKVELAISEHLAKLFAQFALLLGLNEPSRVAIGRDDGEPKQPDPRMVAAIERAQRDNAEVIARARAGLPPWVPPEGEEA